MNGMPSGAARAAASLASVAAAVVLGAAPAAAASAPPTNQSYALQATGSVSVQQAGDATYDGGSPVVLPNVDAAGLLSTGVATDRAGAASASSRLSAVVLALPGHVTLRARAVSSWCRFGGKSPAVTGGAGVTGGVVRAGRRIIRLPATAAPNTRVVIPGSAVIMLNRQFTGPDGTLTVAALRIRMLRGHQEVRLATSVCAAANLAPAPAARRPGDPADPGRPRPAAARGHRLRPQQAPQASRRLTPRRPAGCYGWGRR